MIVMRFFARVSFTLRTFPLLVSRFLSIDTCVFDNFIRLYTED